MAPMTTNMRHLSLWLDSLPADLTRPVGTPLAGDRTVDVAIVGAGFTGLWTAYYLSRRDPSLRIGIIEAEEAGFGASGRNGGWASALFPASLDALARASSRPEAIRMKRTMIDSVDEIARVADLEGWDIRWSKGGTVVAARTPLQWSSAQEEVAHARSWGFGPEDLQLLDRAEAEQRIGATDVLGATYTPHCAALDPARLVRQLAGAVARSGVSIFEHTRARAIEPGVVRTDAGDLRAEIVVRATEGYTRTLAGQTRTLAPVYSMMLATEPLPERTWEQIGLKERETFADGRNLIIYGQRTSDARIAFGGRGAPYHWASRISPDQDRNAAVHAALWEVLVDLFPAVSSAAVTHTWGGPLGVPRDWWASCGLDRSTGLAWSGGYVGDGVTTANLGGRTLADLIVGEQSDLVSLPWVGHRSRAWEPEPFRWLGTNIGLRIMTSADEKETRTGRRSRTAALFARKLGH
ncbi:MAG TPA: FAD-dependent oxidoreductase [Actinobacteria bacterium]|nr:FAD-dependent oxidoreductase [Actinomycetota bacterium]